MQKHMATTFRTPSFPRRRESRMEITWVPACAGTTSTCCIIAGVSLLLAGSYAGELHAQNYPAKLIRVIVPRAPGGGSDILGRLLSPGMQKKLGQNFLLEN